MMINKFLIERIIIDVLFVYGCKRMHDDDVMFWWVQCNVLIERFFLCCRVNGQHANAIHVLSYMFSGMAVESKKRKT